MDDEANDKRLCPTTSGVSEKQKKQIKLSALSGKL